MNHLYFRRAALVTAISFATLQACNREPDFMHSPAVSQDASSQDMIAVVASEAQHWYEAGITTGKHQLLPIEWDKAQSIRIAGEEHVIVPIGDIYDRFATSPYRAYRRLVVRQRNGKPIDGTIIELLVQRSGQEADLEHLFHNLYLAQSGKQRHAPPQLSGAAFFYSSSYAYLTGYRYDHGHVDAQSTYLVLQSSSTQLKAGRGTSNSISGLTSMANAEEGPGPGMPGNPNPYPLGPVTVTSPPPPVVPWPDNPYQTPPSPPPYIPPYNPGGGWGGGGGGGTPPVSNAPATTVNMQIKNLRPCAAQVVQALQAMAKNNPLTGGPIAALINAITGNPNIQVSFNEQPNLVGPSGQTDRAQTVPNGGNNYTIVLNSDFLQGNSSASDLQVAADIVHELLHVYMDDWAVQHSIGTNESLEFIMNLYFSSGNSHEVMTSMVGIMANALMEYYNTSNPPHLQNISSAYCEAVVWGDLMGTAAYQAAAAANPAFGGQVNAISQAEKHPDNTGPGYFVGSFPIQPARGNQPCK